MFVHDDGTTRSRWFPFPNEDVQGRVDYHDELLGPVPAMVPRLDLRKRFRKVCRIPNEKFGTELLR